jgi:transcriptional regulator with XRE-family HTH domain
MKIKSELYRPELHCSVPSQQETITLKNLIELVKEKYNITSTLEIKERLHIITNYSYSAISKILMGLKNPDKAMRPSAEFLHLLCDDLNVNFEKIDLLNECLCEEPKEDPKDVYHDFYNTIPESYRQLIVGLRNVGLNTFNHCDKFFFVETYAINNPIKLCEEFNKIINVCNNKCCFITYQNLYLENSKNCWHISL